MQNIIHYGVYNMYGSSTKDEQFYKVELVHGPGTRFRMVMAARFKTVAVKAHTKIAPCMKQTGQQPLRRWFLCRPMKLQPLKHRKRNKKRNIHMTTPSRTPQKNAVQHCAHFLQGSQLSMRFAHLTISPWHVTLLQQLVLSSKVSFVSSFASPLAVIAESGREVNSISLFSTWFL